MQLDVQGDGVIVAEHSPVRFPAGQSVMHLSIAVRKPTRSKAGQTRGSLTAYLHGDEVPLMTAIPIRYDHIPHQEVWVDGSLPIVTADIAVPKGLQVGYIDGAGDDAPEALKQLGVEVKRLNAATLTEADLLGLTSVVLGIRAFNVNQGLAAAQPVLENWVQNGGHLIIQYNTATRDQVTDHMGPVPFKLGRDRVTVEETPATFLVPKHLMMTYPNALSEADFDWGCKSADSTLRASGTPPLCPCWNGPTPAKPQARRMDHGTFREGSGDLLRFVPLPRMAGWCAGRLPHSCQPRSLPNLRVCKVS